MTLAPYLLALTFGLLISALLYFVLVWPVREPVEEDEAAGGARDAGDGPGPGAASVAGAAPGRSAPRARKSRRRK